MKAKRRLTDFNFESSGSHVALVHAAQGGGANGWTTLVTKATNDISEQEVEKAMASDTESQSLTLGIEDNMQEEIQKAVQSAELVLKAQFEEVIKAKDEEILKAKAKIEEFEKAQVEAVAKARKEAIAAVEKDAEQAEALFKSLEAVSAEAFDVVIKSMKAKEAKLEESDLFVEKGANSEEAADKQQEKVDTMSVLKAKYSK